MLSQAEIDALLGGGSSAPAEQTKEEAGDSPKDLGLLTDEQKDILGEIGNISMGTSATTLFALLGQKVLITTPKVNVMEWGDLSKGYDRPCVGIRVDYIEGIEGSNVMILKELDVKTITSLMMGGDGLSDVDGPINDLDLSAIGEAMNQMVGSASTSLSSLIKMRIDIDTPKAFVLDFSNESEFMANTDFVKEPICCIKFRMQIGKLVDSEIMQMIPLKFATTMVETMEQQLKVSTKPVSGAEDVIPPPTASVMRGTPAQAAPVPAAAQQYASAPAPAYDRGAYIQPEPQAVRQQPVNVRPVEFQTFDTQSLIQQKENIDIIMDVPLEITVELGRTSMKIKEILEFTPGKIIELDKIAGEPIDVLVNGKFVAKGEVVVIEENFCVRITDIVSAENRI